MVGTVEIFQTALSQTPTGYKQGAMHALIEKSCEYTKSMKMLVYFKSVHLKMRHIGPNRIRFLKSEILKQSTQPFCAANVLKI